MRFLPARGLVEWAVMERSFKVKRVDESPQSILDVVNDFLITSRRGPWRLDLAPNHLLRIYRRGKWEASQSGGPTPQPLTYDRFFLLENEIEKEWQDQVNIAFLSSEAAVAIEPHKDFFEVTFEAQCYLNELHKTVGITGRFLSDLTGGFSLFLSGRNWKREEKIRHCMLWTHCPKTLASEADDLLVYLRESQEIMG